MVTRFAAVRYPSSHPIGHDMYMNKSYELYALAVLSESFPKKCEGSQCDEDCCGAGEQEVHSTCGITYPYADSEAR